MCHPDPAQEHPGHWREPGWTQVPTDAGHLPALLVQAAGRERGSVLLIHDIFGASSFYQGLARELAGRGFTTLLPELFWDASPLAEPTLDAAYVRLRSADDRRLFVDQHAAADWLRDRSGSASRIGVVGFCWGGTQTLMLAADRADLAAVCYYGMPFDPGFFSEPGALRPVDVVGRMSGPVVGFWGDRDERAGLDNVRTFLEKAGTEGVQVDGHIFPGVGHGFLRAKSDEEAQPGSPANVSWQIALQFLDRHLGEADADG